MVIENRSNELRTCPRQLELLSEIIRGTEKCADCPSRDTLFWVIINRGVVVCSECALVHRALGRHVSVVKCLRYPPSVTLHSPVNDYWLVEELEMVSYFVKASTAINDFWQGGLSKDRPNPSPVPESRTTTSRPDESVDRAGLKKVAAKKLDKQLSRSRNLLLPRSRIGKTSRSHNKKGVRRSRSRRKSPEENGVGGRFSNHFRYNPLYVDEPAVGQASHPQPSLDRADFVRAKYQLLAYVSDRDKPDVRNPRGAFNGLNKVLQASVRTPKLEASLMALALGADPNHVTGAGPSVSDLALSHGQNLQYRLLSLWGAACQTTTVRGGTDLGATKALRDSRLYQVPDGINRFAKTFLSNKRSLLDFFDPENHYAGHPFPATLRHDKDELHARISRLSPGAFSNLGQDLYDEVDRRENELIDCYLLAGDPEDPRAAPVSCLPVNPDLSALRNRSRQRLSRAPDQSFVRLLEVLVGEYARRDLEYARRLLNAPTPRFEGSKATTCPDHVYDRPTDAATQERGDQPPGGGGFEWRLSRHDRAIEEWNAKLAGLARDTLFNQREVATLARSADKARQENKKVGSLLAKILSTLGSLTNAHHHTNLDAVYDETTWSRYATPAASGPATTSSTSEHVYATIKKPAIADRAAASRNPGANETSNPVGGSDVIHGGCTERFDTFVAVVTNGLRTMLELVSSHLGAGLVPAPKPDPDELGSSWAALRACHETMSVLAVAVEEASRDLYGALTSLVAAPSSTPDDNYDDFGHDWRAMIVSTTKLQVALNAVYPPEPTDDGGPDFLARSGKNFSADAFVNESLHLARTLKSLHDRLGARLVA